MLLCCDKDGGLENVHCYSTRSACFRTGPLLWNIMYVAVLVHCVSKKVTMITFGDHLVVVVLDYFEDV